MSLNDNEYENNYNPNNEAYNQISSYYPESLTLAYLINFYVKNKVNSFFIEASRYNTDNNSEYIQDRFPILMLNKNKYTVYLHNISEYYLQNNFLIQNNNLTCRKSYIVNNYTDNCIIPHIKLLYDINYSQSNLKYNYIKADIHKIEYHDILYKNKNCEEIIVEFAKNNPATKGEHKFEFMKNICNDLIRSQDYHNIIDNFFTNKELQDLMHDPSNDIFRGFKGFVGTISYEFLNAINFNKEKVYINSVRYINESIDIKEWSEDYILSIHDKIKERLLCGDLLAVKYTISSKVRDPILYNYKNTSSEIEYINNNNPYDDAMDYLDSLYNDLNKFKKQLDDLDFYSSFNNFEINEMIHCIIYGWKYINKQLYWKIIKTPSPSPVGNLHSFHGVPIKGIQKATTSMSDCCGIDVSINKNGVNFYGPYWIRVSNTPNSYTDDGGASESKSRA